MSRLQGPVGKRVRGLRTILISRVGDPHGGYPDELSILLLAANVVIAGLAARRRLVSPREADVGGFGLAGEDVLIVFDHVDLGEWRGAGELDLEDRRGGGAEYVAHDVAAVPEIGQDVVSGGVDVAFAKAIQHAL